MKSILYVFAICLAIFVAPVWTCAKSSLLYSITSDDVNFENESSITFESEISIHGSAAIGSNIKIVVTPTDNPEAEEKTYEVTIGATEKLSQMIGLELGENVVAITIEKNDFDPVEFEYTIVRKPPIVKKLLQSLIVIPE